MKIPNDFKSALDRAYQSKSHLDKLFVDQKPFIMRLVRHALRYKPWAMISDDNDMFQEACVWILHYMWEWDDERGTPLEVYVVYNVGVRLKNQVEKELAKKRHPKYPPIEIINDDFEFTEHTSNSFVISSTKNTGVRESVLKGNAPNPEMLIAVRRAYDRINTELPLLARELFECLMLEDGNLFGASRRMRARGRIRMTRPMSDDALRQWLRRNFLPQLQTVLEQEHIIISEPAKL